MTIKETLYEADQIPEDIPEHRPTRQVANGQTPFSLSLPSQSIPSDLENRPLLPLTMSEEKTCGAQEVGIALANGILCAGLGYFAASACCPNITTVAAAFFGVSGAVCCKPVVLCCTAECNDTLPLIMRL